MELSYKQEIGVGVLVIAGVVLFGGMMFWLTGRDIKAEGVPVSIALPTAAGIKVGDPVLVSGVRKGRVTAVALERPGRVLVDLSVDGDVRPRIDATAAIASLDFFGNKNVDYFPGSREEMLPEGTVLDASLAGGLTDIAGDLGGQASELMDSAQAFLNSGLARDLHNTLVAMQRAMAVISSSGQGALVPQMTSTLAATERVLSRIDSSLAGNGGQRLDSLTTNLAILSRNLASATTNLDTVLARMGRGEGTLGKMATDSMLYRNLNQTLVSLDSLLTDLRLRPGRYLTVKVF